MNLNNFTIMDGSYYLIENETYESGRRVILTRDFKECYAGRPKVKVALFGGMFALIYEDGNPCLICTNGYIAFV